MLTLDNVSSVTATQPKCKQNIKQKQLPQSETNLIIYCETLFTIVKCFEGLKVYLLKTQPNLIFSQNGCRLS